MYYWHYTIEKLHALLDYMTIKAVTSALLMLSTFFFGGLYTQALIAVVMLMIFDTLLGVMAARHEGQVISSRKFSQAVVKGGVYFMSISAAYFTDLTVPGQLIQSTMIGFVACTEFISILENMGRMGYATPKKLLNQLRDINNHR